MRKLIFLFSIVCAMMSCTPEELEECKFKKQTIDHQTSQISYVSDGFTTSTLYGVWQLCELGLQQLPALELTEIWLYPDGTALVVANQRYYTDYFTIPSKWRLEGGRLTIPTSQGDITFFIRRYTYPTLYVRDIQGKEGEIVKRRPLTD